MIENHLFFLFYVSELKTTKQSTAAISQPLDVSTNRMQNFTEEQKKRVHVESY